MRIYLIKHKPTGKYLGQSCWRLLDFENAKTYTNIKSARQKITHFVNYDISEVKIKSEFEIEVYGVSLYKTIKVDD